MPAPAARRNFFGHVKRWFRRGRRPVVACIGAAIFLLSISSWYRGIDSLQRYELRMHDILFFWRTAQPPSAKVALVGITASSLDQGQLSKFAGESGVIRQMSENAWPWPRAIHARIIERLFESGARAVAVDIAMPNERDGDDELARVLKKYEGRVVLATLAQIGKDHLGREAITFFYPHPRFTEAAGPDASGLVLYSQDVDATTRRVDFRTSEMRIYGYDDGARDLCLFAVRAVELYSGQRQPDRYREIIDYAGPPATYAYLPVEELFIESIFRGNSPLYQQGNVLRDKLVFYGPIAEIFHDVHKTPLGVMPGVEIHAQLAGALLDGRSVRDASSLAANAMALAGALGAVLVVLLLRSPLWQSAGLLGLGGLFLGGSYLAFVKASILFPIVPWFTGISGTGLLGIIYLFTVERWERVHTRKVLERSVNKRIAKVMLRNADDFDHARRGERRPVAILFSDIRGFTTWSERAEPEHLVGQLNEYFEGMVDLIERDESFGNAQKFIGDAILAAWGDTPENRFGDAEDARRAVSTALNMRVKLRQLNTTWDARTDRSILNIGIGVNIGDVVVGEVGHPDRREYTVLGDGVNFAARLESATKQFHTDCLVGEKIEALTREHFIYRHADFIRVKGKTKPVNVFIPLSDRTVPPPDWLADYHEARQRYLARQFAEAATLFQDVKTRLGGEDFLCDLYLGFCAQFQAEPPPQDWDGSRELTEK